MAALFQIRRGESGSLDNGELFYNTISQSLQLGNNTNTGVITFAKLNEVNTGSFGITGDLIVSGNTTIIGDLTFGDSNATDTITVVADFGSNLIPSQSNVYNIGGVGKEWNNIFANSVSASAFTGSLYGMGNPTSFSTSVDSRLDVLEFTSSNHETRVDLLEAAMSGSNRLYVSPEGNDSNDGTQHKPFKTIKAAVESLGSAIASNIKRYTIFVGSGNYTEQNPIAVPPGVAIVGDTLRTVRLTAANPTKDFFHVHDSNYFYGLRFLDLKHPAFAFSFPCSTAIGTISGGGVSSLTMVHTESGYVNGENVNVIIEGPDNEGGVAATATATVSGGVLSINIDTNGSGYIAGEKPHISIQSPSSKRPVITTSPYIQNCSSITGPFDTSGNKVYRALPYDYSDIDEQGAGGGIRIDGNLVSGSSPLESFVADAFTQVNQGGPGHLVTNKGYAQFVSCFTTFCTYGFKVSNGGFANISNSVIDFGKHGLIAKKYFPTTYNSGSSLETKTSTVSGFVIDENGAGYTGSTAGVTISGGGASVNATAIANVNANGSIDEIVLLTSGSGYIFEPTVTIAAPTGPSGIQATTIADKAKISGISQFLIDLDQDALRGVDISSNLILNDVNYLVTDVQSVVGQPSQRRITTYPAPPSITNGDGVAFHQLSNISTGGLVMEYVGSGVTYNALPKYGGVPIRTREIIEYAPGRVFYSTVDNIGNLKIGDFFSVNQLTGEVTIDANSFNLSGLNAIGPFRRNGVAVGVVLQEVSNNTTLLNAQGIFGEDTVPTQYAVNQYIGLISESFDDRTNKLEATASNYETRIDNLELISASYNTYTQSINSFTASVTQSLNAIHSYTSSLKTALTASGQDITIYGNLTVQGTQTSIQSTTLNVVDKNITLASGSTNSAAANGAGINIDGANVTMSWSDANQRIELNKDFAVTGSISSSTLIGIGNVTIYSTSVDSRLVSLESTDTNVNGRLNSIETYTASVSTSVGLLQTFSASQYKNDSSSFDTRLDGIESKTGSYATITDLNNSSSVLQSNINNKLTTSIFNTYTTTANSRLLALETTSASLNQYTASVSTSVGLLQQFSGSEYKSDSSSFDTRISASTLTFNDTTGQTGIDFTQVGTQVSAIASGLTTGSSVKFSSITASYFSASATIYCDTLVATTLVGATLPVLEYETNGTLGNILIKGATSKSIQVVDTIAFTGMIQNGLDQFSATGLYMTGSITASLGFSGSINGIGNVTEYSTSVDSRIIINSQSAWGAFQSASAYSASAVAIFATTGSNTFKDDQVISGSIYVTGDVVAYSTSDERLKDNIELISNPIEKVNQLRGVEFDWNDKSMFKAGKHDYGVIAQDVEKVLPELVKETHTGYLGVDYDKIVGLLIEVVKEQEKRIKELENKVGS